jgi:hypothetical protein
MKQSFYAPKMADMKFLGARTHYNVTKTRLLEELLIVAKGEKEFGFKICKLPDKQYLLDLIFKFAPDHKYF